MTSPTIGDIGGHRVPEKCLFGHPIPIHQCAIVDMNNGASTGRKRRYAYYVCEQCHVGGNISGRVLIIDVINGVCIAPTLSTLWWIEWSCVRVSSAIYGAHPMDQNYSDQERAILANSDRISYLCHKQAEEAMLAEGFLYPVEKVGDNVVIAFTPHPVKKNIGLN